MRNLEQLEFDDWWKDFNSYHKNDKDGGYDAIRHLQSVVGGFILEKRVSFIDNLIEIDKLSIASDLIELYGNERQKKFIRDKLLECIKTKQYDFYDFIYLKTVINTYRPEDFAIIKLYYQKQTKFNRVIPTELFKINNALFLFAFKKMFVQYSENDIYEYDGLLYLTSHLDILEFLIDNLSLKYAKRIQNFCKVKSTHSCISNDKWKEDLIKLSNKKLRQPTCAINNCRFISYLRGLSRIKFCKA